MSRCSVKITSFCRGDGTGLGMGPAPRGGVGSSATCTGPAGVNISSSYRAYAVVIAFAINYAAYFAEIYRGGIESMPVGQYEAAKVLGYGKTQTFVKIILPQVIKRILPSVTNEVITLVKDTSLAFSIAYAEMFSQAKALAASQKSMIPFVAAAIFYYVFNYVVAFIMEFFEKKMSYYH